MIRNLALAAALTFVAGIVLSGCATKAGSILDNSMAPMIAIRLATVTAVQGDPERAQRVADEATRLLADIDAGQSIALDVLVPLLNSRIAEAALRPAERAVLIELIGAVTAVAQAPSVLPDDARARLRLAISWVRAAALGQATLPPTPVHSLTNPQGDMK